MTNHQGVMDAAGTADQSSCRVCSAWVDLGGDDSVAKNMQQGTWLALVVVVT